jgi:N4-(beta-N-acetylglucosaminyl)-L-asparaginase
VCGGFLTVEFMRRGLTPTDAALEALKRVVAMTPARYLDPQGRPRFQVNFYALNKKGEFGSAALFPSQLPYATDTEARITDRAHLFEPTT